MKVSMATWAEAQEVFRLAKQYDNGFSKHVRVDVPYATEVYRTMIADGTAVVFALKDEGRIVGGLGAIKAPDPHSGTMTAIEMFWFVNPGDRGYGLLLLRAFEGWAAEQGCRRMALVHLVDSFPQELERLYARRGYTLVEKHYVKEV